MLRLLPIVFCICFFSSLFSSCGRKKHEKQVEKHQSNSKEDLLQLLIDGNERFIHGKSIHPHDDIDRIKEVSHHQEPFAVIMSCSDSRVPPEIIFDQGLGDLFVIRTAGNIIGDYELGSIEYAVEHLKSRLIVVLGHENCGAIKAYIQHKKNTSEAEHFSKKSSINKILDDIENKYVEELIEKKLDINEDIAVKENVLYHVNRLKKSRPILENLYEKGVVKIVGAFYDLDEGKIQIIE